MIIEEFLRQVSDLSGITDSSVLYTYLNNAAKEIWDATDFPNTLRECSFRPYDPQLAYISLPHYVYAVRGIVPCRGETTEFMDRAAAYNDDFWLNSPWRWRMVHKSPLHTNISEASQLTIRRSDPKATDEVMVTIGGETDVAEDAKEVVEFTSTDAEKLTENPYSKLSVLAKDVLTSCNFLVLDAAGNEVSKLPNNYKEVSYNIVQVLDSCTSCACTTCQCAKILYKPVLPPFWQETDLIPDGLEQALIFKFREWRDLSSEDKFDRAAIMAEKSAALQSRAAYNLHKGKIAPIPTKRSIFTNYPGVRL